jgi:PKD repeat protein
MIRRLFLVMAAAALGGCSVSPQSAPPLAGPSELGLSVALTATPDVITQDGHSQAVIGVTARDANGQPMRSVSFRVDIFVGATQTDFGTISSRFISTGNDGKSSVTYTAPAAPPPTVTNDTTVSIAFTPMGDNFANTIARAVDLSLVRPGVIVPGDSGLTAAFTISPTSPKIGDTIIFDASTSQTIAGRSITSYQWSFGDGASGTGRIASHQYHDPGTFAATLTVTDDLGRSATVSQSISLSATAPTAAFVFSPTTPLVGEAVSFNGQASKAALGRAIAFYDWDFGDGTSGSGATPQHAFNQARTFNVTLRVKDDLGQESTATVPVTINDIQAVFTVSPTSPTVVPPATTANVSFNASGSKVAAGTTIAGFTWDFGDGAAPQTTTTATTSHAFATGSYTVVLTIQDSRGHTGTTSQAVTVK